VALPFTMTAAGPVPARVLPGSGPGPVPRGSGMPA